MNKSFLHTQFLSRQRVLVRADLNIPTTATGAIKNDKRLRAIIPTIRHIQAGGGKVILATHIGRPSGIGLEHHLSTRNLIPWFEAQGFTIDFESDLLAAQPKTYDNQSRIMLLENLRFSLEKNNTQCHSPKYLPTWLTCSSTMHLARFIEKTHRSHCYHAFSCHTTAAGGFWSSKSLPTLNHCTQHLANH